jgi:hypothetical protein
MSDSEAAVDVTVQVPADHVRDFEVALGALVTNRKAPDAESGAVVGAWQAVTVSVTAPSVPAFYDAFGEWLSTTTQAVKLLDDLTADEMSKHWRALPPAERAFLLLLSDGRGRSVGWPELKTKFHLSGKPSLTRDLPVLTAVCVTPPRRFPVDQDGTGDDTVFTLRPGLVDAIADCGRPPA